jgi:hypothetical protein
MPDRIGCRPKTTAPSHVQSAAALYLFRCKGPSRVPDAESHIPTSRTRLIPTTSFRPILCWVLRV